MLRAGDLNKLVDIQAKTRAKGGFNQTIETPQTIYTNVPAAIRTEGSKEVYYARKLYAETQMVFVIRYRRMRTDYRIKYGNRYFEILGIDDPEEAHTELLISAKEAV